MAHCVRFVLIALVVFTLQLDAEGSSLRKRQLVVGRVGFRPGRSLAIGRGALLKPSGKRSLDASSAGSVAPSLDDLLGPNFRNNYCTNERQELADVLFSNVVQAMRELRQFATICYGSENPTEFGGQPAIPDDLVEYVTDDV